MKPKAELIAELEAVKKELEKAKLEDNNKALDNTIELIRRLMRAKQGLPADDDVYSGLIHVNDMRERTRLDEHNVYGHSYMKLLYDIGGDEWEVMKKIADMEDPYFISLEGEQRKEAILMRRAATVTDAQNLTINLPATNPQDIKQQQEAQPPPPPKKSWIPWKR